MKYEEFKINEFFYTKDATWYCTDLATKRVVALKVEPKRVFNQVYDYKGGKIIKEHETVLPWEEVVKMPYNFDEKVFTEADWGTCTKAPQLVQ